MAKKATYTQMSAELDTVLGRLQQSDIQVDEAVALYEKGLQLVDVLEAHLQALEHTVKRVTVEHTPVDKG